MPLFKPPEPVTIVYVGTCSGLVGVAARALKEALPKRWRPSSVPLVLVAVVIAGLYGLTVWLASLVGLVEEPGAFVPEDLDPLSFISGVTGLLSLLSTILALWIRYGRLKRQIDLDRFVTVSGGVGLIVGVVWRW